MTDIVERLRDRRLMIDKQLRAEAADEIDRLRHPKSEMGEIPDLSGPDDWDALHGYAKEEYLRLHRVPLDSLERHYNQRYMAFMRDCLAMFECREAEEIQDEYCAMKGGE